MKKVLSILFVLSLMALSVVAVKPNGPAAVNGLNGKGTQHLELYEKDANWDPVIGGANGRLTFSDNFVFNAHGLVAGTEYTLIRVADPWPQEVVCLGSDVANKGGNVHISGVFLDGGPKTWLVPSSDTDCEKMTAWNPSEYLFEYATI